ncbi:hypothetical protein [Allorhodopirellula solitaria]|nr:hypothetical protein [Allorhodopirellula solitaria]
MPVTTQCTPTWAASLLSQQIWCWGQDITRTAGNWLIEIGFNRDRPPEERKNCPSVYTLQLDRRTRVVLRGFGIYYGDDRHGGIFLERYGFAPTYTTDSRLVCPPWSNQDLPTLEAPAPNERTDCLMLMLGLFEWIRNYEFDIVDCLGLAYREEVIMRWADGRRVVTPAQQMAVSWRKLSLSLSANPEAWLPSMIPAEERGSKKSRMGRSIELLDTQKYPVRDYRQ